jgi:hypothetical protein
LMPSGAVHTNRTETAKASLPSPARNTREASHARVGVDQGAANGVSVGSTHCFDVIPSLRSIRWTWGDALSPDCVDHREQVGGPGYGLRPPSFTPF